MIEYWKVKQIIEINREYPITAVWTAMPQLFRDNIVVYESVTS